MGVPDILGLMIGLLAPAVAQELSKPKNNLPPGFLSMFEQKQLYGALLRFSLWYACSCISLVGTMPWVVTETITACDGRGQRIHT